MQSITQYSIVGMNDLGLYKKHFLCLTIKCHISVIAVKWRWDLNSPRQGATEQLRTPRNWCRWLVLRRRTRPSSSSGCRAWVYSTGSISWLPPNHPGDTKLAPELPVNANSPADMTSLFLPIVVSCLSQHAHLICFWYWIWISIIWAISKGLWMREM